MLQQAIPGDCGADGGEVAPLVFRVLPIIRAGKGRCNAGKSEGCQQAESGGGFCVEFHGHSAFPNEKSSREMKRKVFSISLDDGLRLFVPGAGQDFSSRLPNHADT